jgi:site-specific DNA-methyltransferase (adenine-specific)
MNDKVVLGDCLAVMKDLPDDCVDSIVCDPPAGIAFMGKEWDKDKGGRLAWVAWMESVAVECLRVLKPGGYALVWALPRTSHWTGWAWENAGWEPRDKIVHLFGSGFPKSLDVSKALDKAAGAEREVLGTYVARGFSGTSPTEDGRNQWAAGEVTDKVGTRTAPATDAARAWQGWGTALKPAAEDWWLFRKPLSEGTVAANVLQYGTGGINIDGCRIETSDKMSFSKAAPFTDAAGEQGRTWNPTSTPGIERVQNAQGRWPANVILGCCGNDPHDPDCAVRLLDEQAGITKSTGGKFSGKNALGQESGWNAHENRPVEINRPMDSGGTSRFFYTAKASRSERTHGGTVENKHPTVKPISLMRYLVRLVTPPGGSVLDPFCGSGSTLVAAELEGFDYLGIEQDPESHKTACERLAHAEVLRKKTDPKTTQVAEEEG